VEENKEAGEEHAETKVAERGSAQQATALLCPTIILHTYGKNWSEWAAAGTKSGNLQKKSGGIFGYYVGIPYITGSFERVNSIVKPPNAAGLSRMGCGGG
jgi:hypothetical protein